MIIRILLFPVALLLILYFSITKIVPTYKAITAEKAHNAILEQELEKVKERQNKVNSFVKSVQEHPEEESFVHAFLPNDQQEELLLNDFSQFAKQLNVSLFSVGFADRGSRLAETDQDMQFIEGNLIVNGAYEDLKAFMDRLFRIRRIYSFKTVDIVSPEESSGENDDSGQSAEHMLNATITFSYGYISGKAQGNISIFDHGVNYDIFETIMNSVANTKDLVSEPKERKNPFLP